MNPEKKRRKIGDLTLEELSWIECPRNLDCDGTRCEFKEANGKCSIKLRMEQHEILIWDIPDWLQPAIVKAHLNMVKYNLIKDKFKRWQDGKTD